MSEEASSSTIGEFAEDVEEVAQAIEEGVVAMRIEARRFGRIRIEHVLFGLVLAYFAAYVIAYFVIGVNLESLKRWGYLGVFLIAMAGSATIVLPTPSTVAIFGSGALLDPVFGLPAPLMVAMVAALGEAIGEFSGYVLGYAGTDVIKHRKAYITFERWMKRRGMLTIFLLCTFPNPLFDIAGAVAGATRMPAARFFVATLGGKFVKDLFLAFGGSFSISLVSDLLSGG